LNIGRDREEKGATIGGKSRKLAIFETCVRVAFGNCLENALDLQLLAIFKYKQVGNPSIGRMTKLIKNYITEFLLATEGR